MYFAQGFEDEQLNKLSSNHKKKIVFFFLSFPNIYIYHLNHSLVWAAMTKWCATVWPETTMVKAGVYVSGGSFWNRLNPRRTLISPQCEFRQQKDLLRTLMETQVVIHWICWGHGAKRDKTWKLGSGALKVSQRLRAGSASKVSWAGTWWSPAIMEGMGQT